MAATAGRRRVQGVTVALGLLLGTLALSPPNVSATPAPHAAKASAAERTHRAVRGVFRVLTRDVPNADGTTRDETRPVLELPNGRWVDLHLPKGKSPSYNDAVELTGVGSDEQLDVETIRHLSPAEAPTAFADGTTTANAYVAGSDQATTGTTSVLVILATWTQPDAVTPASAANVIFTQGNPWWKETSYGQLSLTGKVTSWVHISPPAGDCYTYGDTIMSRARSAAASYSPSSYQRVIVYFPACSGSPGWAFVGAGSVWINGSMDLRVTIHEQGHNYGLGHAHSYSCTAGGRPSTVTGTCYPVEYGDSFDAMGGGSYVGHFSGRHKDLLGWIAGRKKVFASTDHALLSPMEGTGGIVAGVVNVSSTRSYWLEYRTATGKDRGFPAGATGVQVRLVSSAIGDGGPNVLDLRPGDTSSYDDTESISLPTGSSWTSPEGTRIEVTSASASGANVSITGGFSAARPDAPTAVTATGGDTAATVRWTRPDDNGALITSYVVTASPGGRTATVSTLGGTATSALVEGLTNGTSYTFTVVAKNSVGTSNASAPSAPVTPTAAVPTVTITGPAANATVTGDTVAATVSVAASALSKASVSSVEYLLDGEYVGYSTTAPFSATLNLTDTTPGVHVLTATATDTNSRQGKAAPVSFTYAPPFPTVSITSPAPGPLVAPDHVQVTLNAAPGSPSHPLQSVYATLEDGSYAGTASQESGTTWTFDWDLTRLAEGEHTLTAHAADDQQRVVASTPVVVSLTHPMPTVAFVSPADGASLQGTVTAQVHVAPNPAGGPSNDVNDVQVVADGVTLLGTTYAGQPESAGDPWTVTLDVRSLGNGPHTLTAKATSSAGYTATTAPVSVTVANPRPSAVVAVPLSDPVLGTVTLHATAAPDPQPGSTPVSQVLFRVDGTDLGYATDNGGGDWSLDWDTRAGDQGARVVTATVQDVDGYTGVSDGVVFTLNNPGPSVTLTSPAPDAVLGGDVTFTSASATNPDTGTALAAVEYRVDGYTVAYGDGSTSGWSATVPGYYLGAGPHVVDARVSDNDGLTRSSAPVSITFVAPPDAPAGVVATPGDGTVLVEWTPPSFTGGADLTGYRVQQIADYSSTTPLQSVDVGPSVNATTLSGITGDSTYVQVLALGPGGTSYPYATFVDLLPAAPTGVTVTGGDRSLQVTWTPSTSTDVAQVEVHVASGTTPPSLYDYAAFYGDQTSTSAALTGLSPGAAYTVSLVAGDASGNLSAPVTRTLLGTALTTTTSATTVTYGGAVNVTGTLTRAGTTTRLAGKPVVLLQRRHGTAAWSRVASVTTGSTGVATVRRIPTLNTDYAFTFAGSTTDMGVTSAVRLVRVTPRVTAALSTTRVALAHAVTLSGTVAPNHRGQRVYLQQRFGSSWRNVTSAVLSSTSSVRFSIVPRVRGTLYYRLYKSADADHLLAYSPVRALVVV